jgi:hypothetical protein
MPAPDRIVEGLLAVPLTAKLLIANGAITAAAAAAVAGLARGWAPPAGAPPAGALALLALAAVGFSLLANALVVRSARAPLRELERVAAAVDAAPGQGTTVLARVPTDRPRPAPAPALGTA